MLAHMDKPSKFKELRSFGLTPAMQATHRYILEQERLVATLVPGTRDHRLATKVLLLLRDSLYAIASAEVALANANKLSSRH